MGSSSRTARATPTRWRAPQRRWRRSSAACRCSGSASATRSWRSRSADAPSSSSSATTGNQPVKDLTTGRVEITAQNHGFAVDADSLGGRATVTHVNLNDRTVEGLVVKDAPAFSVQYHPEASPGPHDAHYLFRRFVELMERGR